VVVRRACDGRDQEATRKETHPIHRDADRQDVARHVSSTFSDSAGGGIVSGWRTDLDGPNLTGNNTFTNIANGGR
jgi:hypothetical protein